jgi:hypothetical protein
MKELIERLKRKYVNYKWDKLINRIDDGLEPNLSLTRLFEFHKNNQREFPSLLIMRDYTITTKTDSLYNLLVFLDDSIYQLKTSGIFSKINWEESTTSLDKWVMLPKDSKRKGQSYRELLLIAGEKILEIYQLKTELKIPEGYFQRNMKIPELVFIEFAILMGELVYG